MAGGSAGTAGGQDHLPALGHGSALKDAHFVAAPLFTAAALSLAGVVAGADKEFRWPGPTLVLLVITSMTLIFSIQLSYSARDYFYTFQELRDWYADQGDGSAPEDHIRQQYRLVQRVWRQRNNRAVAFYDLGTMLLGLGVAVSLIPPPCGKQLAWRLTAAAIVTVGTVADGIWVFTRKPAP